LRGHYRFRLPGEAPDGDGCEQLTGSIDALVGQAECEHRPEEGIQGSHPAIDLWEQELPEGVVVKGARQHSSRLVKIAWRYGCWYTVDLHHDRQLSQEYIAPDNNFHRFRFSPPFGFIILPRDWII
jgi:hypothetical protein